MKPSCTGLRGRQLLSYRFAALVCLILLLGSSACSSAAPTTPAPTITAAATATTLPSATAPAPTATALATSAVTPTLPALTPSNADPATQAPTGPTPAVTVPFDAQRAMKDVAYQMSLGPRTPGSDAHRQVIEWMVNELEASGWTVEVQETTRMDHPIRNVIAKRGPTGEGVPWVLFGAHFDSRLKADQDPDLAKRSEPVPAANDGASGVAVLLEMARVLPKDLNQQVWLAFFDAEDQGELPGWNWLLGSRVVAESLPGKPDAVIILDMIGDANLNIFQEKNSDPALTREIWDTAARLGYDQYFIAQPKWSMTDDHTPFLEKGIAAIDVIDFDYPYWHTVADTADKVSAQSLKIVGDTMLHWLIQTAQP